MTFHWVSLGSKEVSLGFTRFHCVLMGFTGFYWVLLGFKGVSLGFIRFNLVLLGF